MTLPYCCFNISETQLDFTQSYITLLPQYPNILNYAFTLANFLVLLYIAIPFITELYYCYTTRHRSLHYIYNTQPHPSVHYLNFTGLYRTTPLHYPTEPCSSSRYFTTTKHFPHRTIHNLS